MERLTALGCNGEIEVCFGNGSFLNFDIEKSMAVLYGSDENTTEYHAGISSLGDSSIVCFSDDFLSAFVVDICETTFYRVSSKNPVFSELVHLARTDLLQEGFDYLNIFLIGNDLVCLYEHGIILFCEKLDVVSEVKFENLMVPPIIDGRKFTYKEISETLVYEIVGNKIVRC